MLKWMRGQPVYMGGKPVYKDASGTPKTSPIAIDTNIIEIVPPAGAVFCYLRPRNVDLRIGNDAAHTNGYMIVEAASWSPAITVTNGDSIYVSADSGTDSLNVMFEVLQ